MNSPDIRRFFYCSGRSHYFLRQAPLVNQGSDSKRSKYKKLDGLRWLFSRTGTISINRPARSKVIRFGNRFTIGDTAIRPSRSKPGCSVTICYDRFVGLRSVSPGRTEEFVSPRPTQESPGQVCSRRHWNMKPFWIRLKARLANLSEQGNGKRYRASEPVRKQGRGI